MATKGRERRGQVFLAFVLLLVSGLAPFSASCLLFEPSLTPGFKFLFGSAFAGLLSFLFDKAANWPMCVDSPFKGERFLGDVLGVHVLGTAFWGEEVGVLCRVESMVRSVGSCSSPIAIWLARNWCTAAGRTGMEMLVLHVSSLIPELMKMSLVDISLSPSNTGLVGAETSPLPSKHWSVD